MKDLFDFAGAKLLLLSAWLVVPLLLEIVPAIVGFFMILAKKLCGNPKLALSGVCPRITVIVPVYRSEDTLLACLQSVYRSNYPLSCMDVLLVDNGNEESSQRLFEACRVQFPLLSVQWAKSEEGKAHALNLAIRNSHGKYIIHIDSDGVLEPQALRNMVARFEEKPRLQCLSGVVLPVGEKIERHGFRGTISWKKKLLQKLELLEYGQTFLVGRNREAICNEMYTISGAFSGFRQLALRVGGLYHTKTVCEDTYITFQMRLCFPKGVGFCENAFFFTDPIEGIDDLYRQRQRWQRGELEIAHLFLQAKMKKPWAIFTDFRVRLLLFDHSFAFPRMLWYVVLPCLIFMDYAAFLILEAFLAMYLLYLLAAGANFLACLLFLNEQKELKQLYRKTGKWLFLLPAYSLLLFWFRLAGIINCMVQVGVWNCRSLSEEWAMIKQTVGKDFSGIRRLLRKLNRWINCPKNRKKTRGEPSDDL